MPPSPAAWKVALVYGLTLAAALGIFLIIRSWGEELPAPVAGAAHSPPSHDVAGANTGADPLFHVLLALGVVLVAGRLIGALLARLGQPPVIGEVIAGI